MTHFERQFLEKDFILNQELFYIPVALGWVRLESCPSPLAALLGACWLSFRCLMANL